MKTVLLAALGASPLWAAAHDGHGMTGAHWHATDAWGFVALGAIAVAAALWLRRDDDR